MGEKGLETLDRGAGDAASLKASQKLAEDTQPRDIVVPADQLSKYLVDRQKNGDSDDKVTISRYPNGVKFSRIEGHGLQPGTSHGFEAPPGGEVKDGKVYDHKGKLLAKLDKDMTLHVYSKHGEYIEGKDGNVTFKPKGTSDLQGLHKPGAVSPSKFEDYGVSSDGKTFRFPNGIEYNPKANQVTIPAEYPNFREDKQWNDSGDVVSRSVYDQNGKKLYTWDQTGLHIPTADGVFTQTPDGKVTFESNAKPSTQGRRDTQGTNRRSAPTIDPESLLRQCAESNDPLCGLDLGEF